MIKCWSGMRNCLLYIAILITASSALGQRISGELRLQVTDLSGARLQGTGRIVGDTTGVDRTFETDVEGKVILRGLPPGRYQLTIRSESFAAKVVPIEIVSQLPLEEEVRLEVAPRSN